MISIIREKIFMSLGGKTFFPNSSNGRVFFFSYSRVFFYVSTFPPFPTVTVTVPFLMTGLGPVVCESRCRKETVQPIKNCLPQDVSLTVSCSAAVTVASRWPRPHVVQAELGAVRLADEGSPERILLCGLLSLLEA